jgi:hypothetical protein
MRFGRVLSRRDSNDAIIECEWRKYTRGLSVHDFSQELWLDDLSSERSQDLWALYSELLEAWIALLGLT